MTVRESFLLAPHTSFHIGGPVRLFVEASSAEDVRAAVALAHARSLPFLPLGGGSNILVPDEGVEAVVAKILLDNIVFDGDMVVAGAGVSWEAFVSSAAERGLWGVENLAGIPGSVGGALVQNIGAYGAELADTFAWTEALNTQSGEITRLTAPDVRLAYRTSLFKERRELIILRVALALSSTGEPNLAYADLARAQEVGVALTTPHELATTVRAIRATKFPPSSEGGTAGSFFKNPVVTHQEAAVLAERFPGIPQFLQSEGGAKVSLAWILDHALALKGFSVGKARLYERQPLVVVTDVGAQAADVDALACEVARRVHEATGITIEREVETFGDQEDKERSDYIF